MNVKERHRGRFLVQKANVQRRERERNSVFSPTPHNVTTNIFQIGAHVEKCDWLSVFCIQRFLSFLLRLFSEQPLEELVNLRNSILQQYNLFIQTTKDVFQNAVRNVRDTSQQEKGESGMFYKVFLEKPSLSQRVYNRKITPAPGPFFLKKKKKQRKQHVVYSLLQLFDQENPQKALSSIRVMHDFRHGGENGTVMYDVTNHTTGCRAQLTTLYHNFLSNGSGMENATHHKVR